MNKTIECSEGNIVGESWSSQSSVGNLKLSGTLGCVALINWHRYFDGSQAIAFVSRSSNPNLELMLLDWLILKMTALFSFEAPVADFLSRHFAAVQKA